MKGPKQQNSKTQNLTIRDCLSSSPFVKESLIWKRKTQKYLFKEECKLKPFHKFIRICLCVIRFIKRVFSRKHLTTTSTVVSAKEEFCYDSKSNSVSTDVRDEEI